LLDLGTFIIPSLSSAIIGVEMANAASGSASASTASSPKLVARPRSVAAVGSGNAAVTAAAAAVVHGNNADTACHHIKLYSICPRALAHRSKIWKGRLNFKEEMHRLSKGFFDAPCEYQPIQPASSPWQETGTGWGYAVAFSNMDGLALSH
jgi:hypothetical protein